MGFPLAFGSRKDSAFSWFLILGIARRAAPGDWGLRAGLWWGC